MPHYNRPLASHGLISYRCKSPYGWCMIGAKDHDDAFSEAKRSIQNPQKEDLQVWNGKEYEFIIERP